jgi:hypothetical protein
MAEARSTYAEGTDVPVERSKAELDKLLEKHGADQRVFGANDRDGIALVGFTLQGRQIRINVPIPKLDDIPEPRSGNKGRSKAEMRLKALEQKKRERWRALLLVVKAKLEYIAMGVTTPEREFLADIALPNGTTVGDLLAGKDGELKEIYSSGEMPSNFLLGPATSKR